MVNSLPLAERTFDIRPTLSCLPQQLFRAGWARASGSHRCRRPRWVRPTALHCLLRLWLARISWRPLPGCGRRNRRPAAHRGTNDRYLWGRPVAAAAQAAAVRRRGGDRVRQFNSGAHLRCAIQAQRPQSHRRGSKVCGRTHRASIRRVSNIATHRCCRRLVQAHSGALQPTLPSCRGGGSSGSMRRCHGSQTLTRAQGAEPASLEFILRVHA